MADTTLISWTAHTWNPWLGCTKVSPGCKHCYAERIIERMGRNFTTLWRSKTWNDPYKWQREAAAKGIQEHVFTCSMSDFFHEAADQWRNDAWKVIRETPNLTYQILTKRPENIASRLPEDWGDGWANVWLGTSIETQKYCGRRDLLIQVPARVHFISAEPLLEDISGKLNLEHIEWLIVGGESGPRFRPMPHEWARNLRDECKHQGIAFFFKQSAAIRTEMETRLDGETIQEFPNTIKELVAEL